MPRLYHQRLFHNFVENRFSAEKAMRDFLSQNPTPIFPQNNIILTISEEQNLPQSTLPGREGGQADLVLCRILKDRDQLTAPIQLSLRDEIELWIVELKNVEAGYGAFEQLFDYMTVVKNNPNIQSNIEQEMLRKLCDSCGLQNIQFTDQNSGLQICGCIVAPSFDLLTRTRNNIVEGKQLQDDWRKLKNALANQGVINGGFTLLDAVDAATHVFPLVSLIKLIRFKRGDETILYTENALGSRAERKVRISIDPLEAFNQGLLSEDDRFYFRDNEGGDHEEDVSCQVVRMRGRANAFMMKIKRFRDSNAIQIARLIQGHVILDEQQTGLPMANPETATTCSYTLHCALGIYQPENIQDWGNFGNWNFVRAADGKTLEDIKQELR